MFNKIHDLIRKIPVLTAFVTLSDKKTKGNRKKDAKNPSPLLKMMRVRSPHKRHQGLQERARRMRQLQTGHRRAA